MMDISQPIALLGLNAEARPAAQARDREDRFAELVERQSRFVFRVAYAILRNAGDSEDVAQETFFRIYRSRAWDRMDDERAFLARTAWRIAVDRRRLNQRNITSIEGAPAPNPEHSAIAADQAAAVHRFIDALPEELRQPLALSTVDELSSREIAQVLDIPEGTVRTRLMRARQVLRQKLEASGRRP